MQEPGSLAGNTFTVSSQALVEDEKCFIDLARSPIWVAEEREIIAP